MTKPAKSILDPTFRYYNAASTDVRLTFARARRQLRIAERNAEEAKRIVRPIDAKRRTGK